MVRSILVGLLAGALSAAVSGQEILLDSFHGVGARAAGMGGAYRALSDDVNGLAYNPAGLARIRRPEFSSSFLRSVRTNQSEFFGFTASESVTSTRLGGAGFAYPFPVHRGSMVLAAGFSQRATFDRGIRIDGYDAEVQFLKDGFSRDIGSLGEFSFGGAIDVSLGLSVGLTGFVWDGDNRFEQALTLFDTRDAHGDTVQLFQRVESLDKYEGMGARLGMLYVNPNGGRFGLTIQPPARVEVSSRLEDEYVDEFEDGIDVYAPEQFTDRYEYTLPWEFGVGFAFSKDGLTFAGDATYVDARETAYEQTPSFLEPNVDDFYTQYREHARINLGVEYAIPNQPIRLRTGYFRNPTSYIGGDGLPEVFAQEERQGVTFGASATMQRALSVDVAVVLNQYREREGRRDDNIRTTRWFASVSYRFPK